MNDLLRSEWFKLRTVRLHLGLWAIAAVFVVVVTGLIAFFAEPDGTTSGDVASNVGVSAVLAGLMVSVVAALSVASEFGHGTIRPTLAATPNRVKVFVGKAVVLAAVAAVIGIVVGVVSYVFGFVVFSARGADLSLFDSDGTISVLIGIPIFLIILSMFGYGLGLLIRNSPAAVAIAILWPVIIENIFATVFALSGADDPIRFLPYQSSIALLVDDPSDFANGRIGGGLYFGVVVAVLVAASIAINTRRDV